jgi:hypothetical protein
LLMSDWADFLIIKKARARPSHAAEFVAFE